MGGLAYHVLNRAVKRAEDWQWGSLWRRRNQKRGERAFLQEPEEWPVQPPRNWLAVVKRAQPDEEVEILRRVEPDR